MIILLVSIEIFTKSFPLCKYVNIEIFKIIDGDTISILLDYSISSHTDGKIICIQKKIEEKIRLFGIDCPEPDQLYGKEAKQYLSKLIKNKKVDINEIDRDYYCRPVALIYNKNVCVNEELIKNGLAWVYPKYCKKDFCKEWEKYQEIAKKKKLGLWSLKNPIPPWEFRRKKRQKRD